jgi:ABC-type sugar transport system substrate-binding protein
LKLATLRFLASGTKGSQMAQSSDYRIITFQRKPGYWRASIAPIVQPAAPTRGATILGFVTTEESSSEEAAAIARTALSGSLDS